MTRRNVVHFASEPLRCASCGASSVGTEMVVEEFAYGTGEDSVPLRATVPMRTCRECGFQFTDHHAEDARHDAVCRHLGVMTPREAIGAGADYLVIGRPITAAPDPVEAAQRIAAECQVTNDK